MYGDPGLNTFQQGIYEALTYGMVGQLLPNAPLHGCCMMSLSIA